MDVRDHVRVPHPENNINILCPLRRQGVMDAPVMEPEPQETRSSRVCLNNRELH